MSKLSIVDRDTTLDVQVSETQDYASLATCFQAAGVENKTRYVRQLDTG